MDESVDEIGEFVEAGLLQVRVGGRGVVVYHPSCLITATKPIDTGFEGDEGRPLLFECFHMKSEDSMNRVQVAFGRTGIP